MSAVLLVFTAAMHSVLGERLLLKPLLARRESVLKSDFARMILRFAWHITSFSWLVLAAIMIAFALKPHEAFQWSLLAVGSTFTLIGIFDALASRGRHVGWPFLTAIGLCALGALVSNQ
jgi:hypothetical protein